MTSAPNPKFANEGAAQMMRTSESDHQASRLGALTRIAVGVMLKGHTQRISVLPGAAGRNSTMLEVTIPNAVE